MTKDNHGRCKSTLSYLFRSVKEAVKISVSEAKTTSAFLHLSYFRTISSHETSKYSRTQTMNDDFTYLLSLAFG